MLLFISFSGVLEIVENRGASIKFTLEKILWQLK
jgi:hypothetical protein